MDTGKAADRIGEGDGGVMMPPRRRYLWVVGVCAAGILVYGLATMQRSFWEFLPKRLLLHTRTVPTAPFIPFAIGPPKFGPNIRTPLMKWLITEGLFAESHAGNQMWVAMEANAARMGRRIDGRQLVAELHDSTWIDWTKEHPESRADWDKFCRALLEYEEMQAIADAQTIIVAMRDKRRRMQSGGG